MHFRKATSRSGARDGAGRRAWRRASVRSESPYKSQVLDFYDTKTGFQPAGSANSRLEASSTENFSENSMMSFSTVSPCTSRTPIRRVGPWAAGLSVLPMARGSWASGRRSGDIGTMRQARRRTGWKRRPARSGGAGEDGRKQQPVHGGTGDAGLAPARGILFEDADPRPNAGLRVGPLL